MKSFWIAAGALAVLIFSGCGNHDNGRVSKEAARSSPPVSMAVHDSISATDSTSATRAVEWIQSYYAAINARRYREAYEHWARGGEASRKTFEEFQKGFAETESTAVTTGPPGPIEGAAGSRYVEVPVRIVARTRAGTRQDFVGTYTLRLSVVDGATPEQRTWHFESAAVRPAAP